MRSAPETFASRSDADRWLAVIRADLLRGNWTAPERSGVTLPDFTTGWLRQRTSQLRPRNLDLYRRLAERWVLAPVGRTRRQVDLAAVPLRSITPVLVREWHAAVALAATTSATTRAERAAMPGNPARAWAQAAGLPVAATGRLSPSIRAAWVAAGSPMPATSPPEPPRSCSRPRPAPRSPQAPEAKPCPKLARSKDAPTPPGTTSATPARPSPPKQAPPKPNTCAASATHHPEPPPSTNTPPSTETPT